MCAKGAGGHKWCCRGRARTASCVTSSPCPRPRACSGGRAPLHLSPVGPPPAAAPPGPARSQVLKRLRVVECRIPPVALRAPVGRQRACERAGTSGDTAGQARAVQHQQWQVEGQEARPAELPRAVTLAQAPPVGWLPAVHLVAAGAAWPITPRPITQTRWHTRAMQHRSVSLFPTPPVKRLLCISATDMVIMPLM